MKLDNILETEYKDVMQKDISTISHTDNSSAIKNLFHQFLKEVHFYSNHALTKKNLLAKQMIEAFSHEYEKEDITSCSYRREDITLASVNIMQELKSGINVLNGIFLTNLVQVHYEKNQKKYPRRNESYTIITELSDTLLDGFGYQMNGPSVHIQGSVGYYTGYEMINGSIITSGDSFGNLGEHMKGGTIQTQEALMQVGEKMENGTIIVSKHCKGPIGMQMNGGNIIVEKNAHAHIGYSMQGGSIHIKGDANRSIGKRMTGGEIIINGSCKTEVGYLMLGGKIHIKKNIGRFVGRAIRGGEIHIDGTIEGDLPSYQSDFFPNGKIFQNEKQIFPRVEE